MISMKSRRVFSNFPFPTTPFFSLLRFEKLSHNFSRSLCIACRLWVELNSDFLLFGTFLPLPLEHKQSIPWMDTTYHGNTSLLLVSFIPAFTSKISDANKNAIVLYYSVCAVAFTKAVLLEVKKIFLHQPE